MPIGNKKDSFEAEFEAMVFEVNFTIYHKFLNLVIESDCKHLCRYLWGLDPIPLDQRQQFLRLRLDELSAYSIFTSSEGCNSVADNLATTVTCSSVIRGNKMRTTRFCARQEEKGKSYYTVNRKFHMDCSSSTSTNADSFPRPINRRQNRGQSVTTQRKAFHEDETHNPTQRVQNARIGDDNVMAAKIQVLEGQQANMKMMIVCLGTVLLCLLCFSVLK
ncbi:hypothetical protein RHGRI_018428 [Rhododendron griersonianum]|uniref:RNase H type-1 domain-containing protein n=1 Tax=Rhododendron griersonianum TaxID=479676 RepID=A0AAV6K1G1_9ERIC|nr:hypothetical protein RHGRI_018428 [Rhododendron griersonianum]